MSKVTVYQYTILDLKRVERRKSRRWGTREGIQSLSDLTEIIEGTGVEVDASAVDSLGSPRWISTPAPQMLIARTVNDAADGALMEV